MKTADLSFEDLESIFNCEDSRIAEEYEFYPLSSEGMPSPGANFINCANLWAKTDDDPNWLLKYIYFRSLYADTDDFQITIDTGADFQSFAVIPGHLWGGAATGPIIPKGLPRVMIIGKSPGLDELQYHRNFVSESSIYLKELLVELGLPEKQINDFYVTSLVRWFYKNPKSNRLPAKWIKDCLPLLHQEFRLIKPDIVLCLGAEATKAVCDISLTAMTGQVLDVEIPIYKPGEEPAYHTMKVMAIQNPAAIYYRPETEPSFKVSLTQFVELVKGQKVTGRMDDIQIDTINNINELRALISEINQQKGIKKLGVDLEWEGRYPTEEDSWVRTIQISHKPRYAAVIKLRHDTGEVSFEPNLDVMTKELIKLWQQPDIQVGGAHFMADLPWLDSLGIPASQQFRVPQKLEDLNGGNYAGGFDVAVAEHAHNEVGPFDFKKLAVLRCNAEPWNNELDNWLDQHCKRLGIDRKNLTGYGAVPDEILIPYGGLDAALTREAMDIECELLNSDRFKASCWEPFHRTMLALPAFLEMHMTGICLDRERVNELTDLYMEIRADKLQRFRDKVRWPNFNPRSSPQSVELLFGEKYNNKIDRNTGKPIRIRPEGALSLNLTPVKSTDKQSWENIANKGETEIRRFTPSTDREVCGILAAQNELAGDLRDIRFIDHILKGVLRVPRIKDNHFELDKNNNRIYDGGLISFILADDRVRSTFSPLKETGRAGSSRPPLQNLAKRREASYAMIAGDKYQAPMRSILCGSSVIGTGDTVLVEVDFKGAELFVEAITARDRVMIDHCIRANLPEDDDNFYDIHSNVTINAFKLNCEPTPAALASIGKKHLRVAAKAVIFGSLYDRSPEAIARQCQEEGTYITADEAAIIQAAIFDMYRGVPLLQDDTRKRVDNEGWIQNYYGRRRRFFGIRDDKMASAMKREALNFIPQATVADAMNCALNNLLTHPLRDEVGYKIVLQLHDAGMLEVPERSVPVVCNEIIPDCFAKNVSFKACDLNGVPYPDSEDYRFGLDIQVYRRWGQKLSKEEMETIQCVSY